MGKEQPIKSPFQFSEAKQKVIQTHELAQDMVDGFSATLSGLEDRGLETNAATLTTFMAGFTCTLKALGFPPKVAMEMTREAARKIVDVGMSDKPDCDCEECKKDYD